MSRKDWGIFLGTMLLIGIFPWLVKPFKAVSHYIDIMVFAGIFTLISIGLSMLMGGSIRGKIQGDAGASLNSRLFVNAFAVLGGVQQSNNSQDFRGGESSAIMGGCEIDLRQASIAGEEAVISTFAMWGGIKIKVPTAWNVIVQGVPFLGGFDDKSAKPSDPAAKRLVVRGTAIMGGVEVTN